MRFEKTMKTVRFIFISAAQSTESLSCRRYSSNRISDALNVKQTGIQIVVIVIMLNL